MECANLACVVFPFMSHLNLSLHHLLMQPHSFTFLSLNFLKQAVQFLLLSQHGAMIPDLGTDQVLLHLSLFLL